MSVEFYSTQSGLQKLFLNIFVLFCVEKNCKSYHLNLNTLVLASFRFNIAQNPLHISNDNKFKYLEDRLWAL